MLPKKRNLWSVYPPAMRQHAFELWVDGRKSFTEIAHILNISRSTVQTFSRKDEWRKRYDERCAQLREQYDANTSKLIEEAKPQLAFRGLKIMRKHDAYLDEALDLAHKKLKSTHEVDAKVLTAISKAATNTVTSGQKLIKPESSLAPRGNTFMKGSVCIVGLQPIRKLESTPQAALDSAKPIEIEEIVQAF